MPLTDRERQRTWDDVAGQPAGGLTIAAPADAPRRSAGRRQRPDGPTAERRSADQLPLAVVFLAVLFIVLALLLKAVIAPRQITMIMASKTEYSTAVGPPSAVRNATTLCAN
jgi:hypothetical protein